MLLRLSSKPMNALTASARIFLLCAGFFTSVIANAGQFSLTDISSEWIPAARGGDQGALWLDADGDNRLELLFVNHIAPLGFWRQKQR